MQPAGDVVAAGLDEQALDVEEEILVSAVVRGGSDVVERDGRERVPERAGVRRGEDPPVREHHEVGVMNRH